MHNSSNFSAFIWCHGENSLILVTFFWVTMNWYRSNFCVSIRKTSKYQGILFFEAICVQLYKCLGNRFRATKTVQFSKKRSVTINLNLQIFFSFFQKYHELLDLFMHFKTIYNTLQIFTLERSVLLRNVLTRFSQLQIFVALFRYHFGTLSGSISQCILLYFYFFFER